MSRDDRKTRADNFSEEDKGLLLSLIADHVSVLENRKTDHKNNSAKYKAWAKISKKFHRQASHPRNFTQMKDLYRRLKLKAKKDVGLWMKACVETGSLTLAPGSQVVIPDDTSLLVYEMIKPYKDDLNQDIVEQEKYLAEALKSRDLTEASFLKFEEAAKDSEKGEEEISDEDEAIPKIKQEVDYDYVPPHVVETVEEEADEIPEQHPLQSSPTPRKRRSAENRLRCSGSLFTNALRRQQVADNQWDFAPKRRRTLPSALERGGSSSNGPQLRRSSFANRRHPWVGPSSAYSRDSLGEKHSRDGDEEDAVTGMSAYEEGMFQMAQAEHKAKMMVMQTQRRAETAKEEAYKMIWQNAQLQRDLLQLQYENVL